ncbi:MAG: tetratricopeptide repeat-containing serine protease family protein [Planctomycetota bacterium]
MDPQIKQTRIQLTTLILLLGATPGVTAAPASTGTIAADTAIAQMQQEAARNPRQIYAQTLPAVVLLTGELDGQTWMGTGWIVDQQRRWIVTNQHVAKQARNLDVHFPDLKDGQASMEFKEFFAQSRPVRGKVIDSDVTIDLALIEVESLPPHAVALPLAAQSASPGDRVHAIGGAAKHSIGLWKYSIGYVNVVAEYPLLTGHTTRVMQSNIDTTFGTSGGPIVNDQGEVVAVVHGGSQADHRVTLNIDVPVVRSYVEEVRTLSDAKTESSLIEMGRRHLREQRPATALEYLSQAIQQNADAADAYVVRGDAFFATQDYPTALADYTQATQLNTGSAAAWYGRSKAQAYMQLFDEAFDDISKAIRHDPVRGDFYNFRGQVQAQRGESNLALGDLTRATELEPQRAKFHKDRGIQLRAMQRSQEAIESLGRAVELSPQDAMATNLLGLGFADLQEINRAAELFYHAFQLDNTNPQFIANFGDAMQISDRLDGQQLAVEAFGTAINLDHQNAYYDGERAWSLRHLQRYQDAWQDINAAIRLNDQVGFYFAERAEILEAWGEAERAEEDRQRAASLDSRYARKPVESAVASEPTAKPASTPVSVPTPAPIVGNWYVNQYIEGRRVQLWQTYNADGTYHATHKYQDELGQPITETEQGSYVMRDGEIELQTNYGHYFRQVRFEDDMLFVLFEQDQIWVGSVRK